eukprot:g14595.t1
MRRTEAQARFMVMVWSGALDCVGPGRAVLGVWGRVSSQGPVRGEGYGEVWGRRRWAEAKARFTVMVWAGALDWVGLGRAGAVTGCRPGFGWKLKARVWSQGPGLGLGFVSGAEGRGRVRNSLGFGLGPRTGCGPWL